MIATRNRDEFLFSTVIKLIKRRAIPNLKKRYRKDTFGGFCVLVFALSPRRENTAF